MVITLMVNFGDYDGDSGDDYMVIVVMIVMIIG
jgi:hypothetical protein